MHAQSDAGRHALVLASTRKRCITRRNVRQLPARERCTPRGTAIVSCVSSRVTKAARRGDPGAGRHGVAGWGVWWLDECMDEAMQPTWRRGAWLHTSRACTVRGSRLSAASLSASLTGIIVSLIAVGFSAWLSSSGVDRRVWNGNDQRVCHCRRQLQPHPAQDEMTEPEPGRP